MEQTSNLFNILYSQNYEYVGVTDEDILKIIQEQILTLLSHKHEYFPGNISRRVIWGAESTTRTSLYGYDHTWSSFWFSNKQHYLSGMVAYLGGWHTLRRIPSSYLLCHKYHVKHTPEHCKLDCLRSESNGSTTSKQSRTGMEVYCACAHRLYVAPRQGVRHLNICHRHPHTNKARTT